MIFLFAASISKWCVFSVAINRDNILILLFLRKIEIGFEGREDTRNKGALWNHGKGTFLRTRICVRAIGHGKKVEPPLPFQMKDLVNLNLATVSICGS